MLIFIIITTIIAIPLYLLVLLPIETRDLLRLKEKTNYSHEELKCIKINIAILTFFTCIPVLNIFIIVITLINIFLGK